MGTGKGAAPPCSYTERPHGAQPSSPSTAIREPTPFKNVQQKAPPPQLQLAAAGLSQLEHSLPVDHSQAGSPKTKPPPPNPGGIPAAASNALTKPPPAMQG